MIYCIENTKQYIYTYNVYIHYICIYIVLYSLYNISLTIWSKFKIEIHSGWDWTKHFCSWFLYFKYILVLLVHGCWLFVCQPWPLLWSTNPLQSRLLLLRLFLKSAFLYLSICVFYILTHFRQTIYNCKLPSLSDFVQ